MPIVERVGAALADKVRSRSRPRSSRRPWAASCLDREVARQLRARFIFAEKEEGKLVLRRGFKITPGERILIVEDVVTKGGRVQKPSRSSAPTRAWSLPSPLPSTDPMAR